MAQKIVFILDSTSNPNDCKRIDEFVNNGYDVKVFAFVRDRSKKLLCSVPYIEIGDFQSNDSYFKRFPIMRKGIKRVLNETKGDECIFYLFGNGLPLIFCMLTRKPYIYEEADLTFTYMREPAKTVFKHLDGYIIRHAIASVFRSEGFVKYHFGNKVPENVFVIPNRLSPKILSQTIPISNTQNVNHLRFAFVGNIRFKSVYNIAKIIVERFPQHEIHLYGGFAQKEEEDIFGKLSEHKNYFYHGKFNSPHDLPEIYSDVDLLICTYDVEFENVQYAEPNKLYEAIYFETPIIVSIGTFLAEKVNRLGIGYEIDAMDVDAITNFINNLTEESIKEKQLKAASIDKNELVNVNDEFFCKLNKIINFL